MANRVVEVYYQLKDLFSGQVKKIASGYSDLRRSSAKAADQIESDNKRSASSFTRLTSAINKLRFGWASLATAVVTSGVGAAIDKFARQDDAVAKLASKLGVATDELTALGYAAGRSNVEFNTLATAVQRMTRRSSEAAIGIGEAKDAFRELGIDAKTFTGLGLEDQMSMLAEAFAGVSNQGDRVRLAFKIFDTEGVSMVNMLQKGSEEMARLTGEARQLGIVLSKEAAEAAEKYTDTMAKLDATLEGIKRRTATPTIEWLNDAAAALGIAADETDNLRKQQEYLQDRMSYGLTLDSFSPYTWFAQLQNLVGDRDFINELSAVDQKLKDLEKTQSDIAETSTQGQQAAAERKAIAEEEKRDYASVAESAEYALKVKKDALKKETDELRKARADQLSVEQEFKRLVDDITKTETEDVILGDVFGANNKARAALAKGESDEAIRLAREGGDLLTKLKEKGTETGLTLGFLAKQLQDVANKASAEKAAKEGKDVDVAANTLKVLEAQITVMKNTAKDAGEAAGLAYAEAMQAAMAQITLAPPPVSPAQPAINRDGNSYSHRRQLDKKGPK